MKKKTYLLGMAVLVAALLALSGVAQSAMWVGAELGGTFQPNTNFTVNGNTTGGSQVMPAVVGGLTLGYDFVNAGFGAYGWPDWMKYFSVATDFTFNRLSIQDAGPGIGALFPANSRLNGYEAVWSFLLMAHYGFLPDSEVPSGRINPYIGVGPGIVFSGVNYSLPVLPNLITKGGVGTNAHYSASSTNVALVVEPGIRWMALKNVSIDTAMRWRFSEPSWDDGNGNTIKANPLSQWAVLVRANYHF